MPSITQPQLLIHIASFLDARSLVAMANSNRMTRSLLMQNKDTAQPLWSRLARIHGKTSEKPPSRTLTHYFGKRKPEGQLVPIAKVRAVATGGNFKPARYHDGEILRHVHLPEIQIVQRDLVAQRELGKRIRDGAEVRYRTCAVQCIDRETKCRAQLRAARDEFMRAHTCSTCSRTHKTPNATHVCAPPTARDEARKLKLLKKWNESIHNSRERQKQHIRKLREKRSQFIEVRRCAVCLRYRGRPIEDTDEDTKYMERIRDIPKICESCRKTDIRLFNQHDVMHALRFGSDLSVIVENIHNTHPESYPAHHRLLRAEGEQHADCGCMVVSSHLPPVALRKGYNGRIQCWGLCDLTPKELANVRNGYSLWERNPRTDYYAL